MADKTPPPKLVDRLEIIQVTMPYPLARSLYMTACKDDARTVLYNTVMVKKDEAGKRDNLAATDTHTLLICTAPCVLDRLEAGLYLQIHPPVKSGPYGYLYLRKLDQEPVKWERVVPKKESLQATGRFESGSGRLHIETVVCLSFRKLAALVSSNYRISKQIKDGKPTSVHLLESEHDDDGWNWSYLLMGMVTEENKIP